MSDGAINFLGVVLWFLFLAMNILFWWPLLAYSYRYWFPA